MRKTVGKREEPGDEGMRADYSEHFRKGRILRNKYAAGLSGEAVLAVLDDDVAEVFTTTQAVNDALRTILRARLSGKGNGHRQN